jgi:hypothetical protein
MLHRTCCSFENQRRRDELATSKWAPRAMCETRFRIRFGVTRAGGSRLRQHKSNLVTAVLHSQTV